MKIGILTLPLTINYGCILQAYALQKVLTRMGHEVFLLVDYDIVKYKSIYLWPAVFLRRVVVRYVLKNKNVHIFQERWDRQRNLYKRQNIFPFIEENISVVKVSKLSRVNKMGFDAIVVGSDQVWRPKFVDSIGKYYLDFLKEKANIIRIAYAASFGVNEWEYTPKQTRECSKLAKRFDLITVRESSGVSLTANFLQVKSRVVLDPTLLLSKEDYIDIIRGTGVCLNSEDVLFAYILDQTQTKLSFVLSSSGKLGLKPLCMGFDGDSPYASVPEWLLSFHKAKFVITDSFHGCVFSIIFNKPFFVIGNEKRGMARFDSLLSMFGLKQRLVDENVLSEVDLEMPIDWEFVNEKKSQMCVCSLECLAKVLNND